MTPVSEIRGMEKIVVLVKADIIEPKARTRRLPTWGMLRGSSSPSNSDQKYVPNYLRPPRSTYHDYCKYGRRRTEIRSPSRHGLGKKVPHEDPYEVNDLILKETRNELATKNKSPSQVNTKVIKQIALQHPSTSHGYIASDEQEILSMALEIEQSQVSARISQGNRIANQENEAKTSREVKRSTHKPKFIDLYLSSDNENGTAGEHRIIRKEPTSSPMQKASSSTKSIVLKKTSIRCNTKPDTCQRFKQRALEPSKMVDTSVKPAMDLKAKKTSTSRIKSPMTTLGLSACKNEGCKITNTRHITKMIEKKTLKRPVTSQSYKAAADGLLSSKPEKYSHEELPSIMKNLEVGMEKSDEENNEEKAIYVIEPNIESFGSEGLLQDLPNSVNVDFDSVTQTLWELADANRDSSLHGSIESKCVDLYFLEPNSPKAHCIDLNLNCLEQKSEDEWLSQPVSYDEGNTKELESAFIESSELESENDESKSSSDLNSLQQKSKDDLSFQSVVLYAKETEESEFAFTESESTFTESSEVEFENGETDSSFDNKSFSSDRRWLRETPIAPPEENLIAPYKLRFRQEGTVFANKPGSNDLIRLKFQRRVIMAENNNDGQVGSRDFCRIPILEDAVSMYPDPVEPRIILRSQDTHQQKELQSLFNNVIEETASKLVEGRKSKVQALVGAFETVISLQDE